MKMKRLILAAMLAATAPLAASAYQFVSPEDEAKMAIEDWKWGWSDRHEGSQRNLTLSTIVSAFVRTANGISRYSGGMISIFK